MACHSKPNLEEHAREDGDVRQHERLAVTGAPLAAAAASALAAAVMVLQNLDRFLRLRHSFWKLLLVVNGDDPYAPHHE